MCPHRLSSLWKLSLWNSSSSALHWVSGETLFPKKRCRLDKYVKDAKVSERQRRGVEWASTSVFSPCGEEWDSTVPDYKFRISLHAFWDTPVAKVTRFHHSQLWTSCNFGGRKGRKGENRSPWELWIWHPSCPLTQSLQVKAKFKEKQDFRTVPVQVNAVTQQTGFTNKAERTESESGKCFLSSLSVVAQ